jgi:hypothetical protein
MNVATISPIALPDAMAERLASPVAAPLEQRRFIVDGSVRKTPEAEDTTP